MTILCVTLNPCLDKTLTVAPWRPGDNVRGKSLHEVVGGKGNNVARALKALGHRTVRPVTFLGGSVGEYCEHLLRSKDEFDPLVIPSVAPTRVILTVRTEGNDEQTAFFDPDPAISPTEAENLFVKVEVAIHSGGVRALSLSGSSPSAATHGLYCELIGLAHTRRIPVYLDTYGPALAAIWGLWPRVLQLNRREAGLYLGVKSPNDVQVIEFLTRWAEHGVTLGVVTDGPGQVIACHEGDILRATPPSIKVVNPIGSGDSLLAGLVDADLKRKPPEDWLGWGIACASANASVWDAGAITTELVSELVRRVVVERVVG